MSSPRSTLVSAAIYAAVGTAGTAAFLWSIGAPLTTVAFAAALLAGGQFIVMRSLLPGWIRYRRAALVLASQWTVGAIGGGLLALLSGAAAGDPARTLVASALVALGLLALARLAMDVPEPVLLVVALLVELGLALGLYWLVDGLVRAVG